MKGGPRDPARLHYGRGLDAAAKDPTSTLIVGEVFGPVEKKLRLHREYSIKLMLAWESVCRFEDSLPAFEHDC